MVVAGFPDLACLRVRDADVGHVASAALEVLALGVSNEGEGGATVTVLRADDHDAVGG